jgi:hypothetical protein
MCECSSCAILKCCKKHKKVYLSFKIIHVFVCVYIIFKPRAKNTSQLKKWDKKLHYFTTPKTDCLSILFYARAHSALRFCADFFHTYKFYFTMIFFIYMLCFTTILLIRLVCGLRSKAKIFSSKFKIIIYKTSHILMKIVHTHQILRKGGTEEKMLEKKKLRFCVCMWVRF